MIVKTTGLETFVNLFNLFIKIHNGTSVLRTLKF